MKEFMEKIADFFDLFGMMGIAKELRKESKNNLFPRLEETKQKNNLLSYLKRYN
jgi:hypothetical protein